MCFITLPFLTVLFLLYWMSCIHLRQACTFSQICPSLWQKQAVFSKLSKIIRSFSSAFYSSMMVESWSWVVFFVFPWCTVVVPIRKEAGRRSTVYFARSSGTVLFSICSTRYSIPRVARLAHRGSFLLASSAPSHPIPRGPNAFSAEWRAWKRFSSAAQ